MRCVCVRLIDQGDFKKRSSFVSLLWNIKHRDSFPISMSEPKLRDLSRVDEHSFCRLTPPEGKTALYVGDLYVATCTESRREMLIGEVIGFNPKLPLKEYGDYSIDVHGGTRNDVLTEIDYFTIDEDETGLWKPLQITNITPLKEWCIENK